MRNKIIEEKTQIWIRSLLDLAQKIMELEEKFKEIFHNKV